MGPIVSAGRLGACLHHSRRGADPRPGLHYLRPHAPSHSTRPSGVPIMEPNVPRIIVVDDSPEIRDVLRTVLELEGFEVVEASDGAEALALSLQRDDVMLLDVMMPGVDGYGVLAGLRERGADMPRVIMLTAKSGELDRQRALSRGAHGFVTKPFDIEDVLNEIQLVKEKGEDELAQRRDHEIYLSRIISQLERLPKSERPAQD